MKTAPTPRRTQAQPENSFIRLPKVQVRLGGVGRTTVYRLMAENEFPLPRQIGGRSVGWLESEVSAWLAARPVSPHLGKIRPTAVSAKPARPRPVAVLEGEE